MPVVRLAPPPDLGPTATYGDYGPWLHAHFFDHICSYCLLRALDVEIDHHEPVAYAPLREHDPHNLLLGCKACNGPGGKWDYHPLHARRRRKRRDATGYRLIDIRRDDFAALFSVGADGSISAREGHAETDRARWNLSLFKLDLKGKERLSVLRLKDACEKLLLAIQDGKLEWQSTLDELIPELAERAMLLRIYGISVSLALQQRVDLATPR